MKNAPNNLAIAFDLQTDFPRTFRTIKHLHLRDVMEIPKKNPDVEQIVTITVNVEIVKTSINKAVEGKSVIGKDKEMFSNRKLEVEGRVHQKIEYVTELSDNPTYSSSFVLPFNTFVTLEEDMEEYSEFEVKGYVRDVLIKLLDKRKIYKNVQLVLTALPVIKI